MIPAACGYAGGRFIWFAGDRVRWMVDKRLNTKKASDYSEAFNSVELRGLPPYVGIPPFFRCVVTLGTNSGTLRGFFLSIYRISLSIWKTVLEPEKILAAYADDGEHEVLAIVSENTVNNVREFS